MAAAVAGFEMLCYLGGFSSVGDDASYLMAVLDQSVDDVHALASVCSHDKDGGSRRERVEVDDRLCATGFASDVLWRCGA